MFFDRISFVTSTVGQGTISVGLPVVGFRTPVMAGVADGAVVEYAIEDGAAWETGNGVIGNSGTLLTRTLSQSSTGSLLNLTGNAKCFFTPIAAGRVMTSPTGWASYVHTGAPQVLTANAKVTLTNNAGTIIQPEKPADIDSFYADGLITGRNGDSIVLAVNFTFTPSDGTTSKIWMAIDLGGAIGEIEPDEYMVLNGSGVAHRVNYTKAPYMGATFAANGGAIKVMPDGPGVATAMIFTAHRLHRA